MMMRGRKDESKMMMSPMFPRLHVNDKEKGGPKAPPRNKMALYEQLSIPSQRLNSGSLSSLPPPPSKNTNNLVPLISASNGEGTESSMFMPFGKSHEPSILAEKFHSYSVRGTKRCSTKDNRDNTFSKATDYHSSVTTPPAPVVPERNAFQPLHFSNFEKFSPRKLGNNDVPRVPTPCPSGIDRNCSKQSEDREQFPKLNLSSSMQIQRNDEISVGPKSRRYVGNRQAEENGRFFRSNQGLMEISNRSGDEILAHTSSDLSTKIKNSESLKRPHDACNKENKNSSELLNREVRANAWLNLMESGRSLGNVSNVRNEFCSRQSLGVDNGSLNELENGSKANEENNTGAMQVRGLDRHNSVPNTSMAESASRSNIHPDDLVGVIGQKHFWKVRKAIVNQQRIFAVQIFELHRLIKVQRLIAESPHILLEDICYTGKSYLDVSPKKKFPSDDGPEPPLIVEDNSQKPSISIERADENVVAKLPLPSAGGDTSKGLATLRPKIGPYSGNALSIPMDANTRSQWLVPVMSPSEGLVYKPYAGPCPPNAGMLAPVYGNCGPPNLAAGGGDFLNTTYGVPTFHQHGIGAIPCNPPIGQTYFPHYGMPVRNPSVTGSTVEQIAMFAGFQSKGNQLSTGDVNFTIPQQSSCDMSSQMNQAISYGVRKLPASKDNEIQGSTASSPFERARGDTLPLFPTKPTTQACTHNAQTGGEKTRVIKVIPHNRRLATESAARIFRSIQEERKRYD